MKQIALYPYITIKKDFRTRSFSLTHLLFLIFLLTVSWVCAAKGKDTLFVDQQLAPAVKAKAQFFIIKDDFKKSKDEERWTENTYYITGQLYRSVPVILTKSNYGNSVRKDGKYREFYPNGYIKSERNYKMGKRVGEYAEYYADGKLKIKGKIDDFNKVFIYNMYDTLGNDQLKQGNGLVAAFDSTWSCLSYFEVIDSVKAYTYFIDSLSSDTIYTHTKMRMKNSHSHFGENIMVSDLPYQKVKKHLGKKLYVICIVDENGKVVDVRNKNSINPEVDTLLINKVRNTANFEPPILNNGRKVKAAVIMPLVL